MRNYGFAFELNICLGCITNSRLLTRCFTKPYVGCLGVAESISIPPNNRISSIPQANEYRIVSGGAPEKWAIGVCQVTVGWPVEPVELVELLLEASEGGGVASVDSVEEFSSERDSEELECTLEGGLCSNRLLISSTKTCMSFEQTTQRRWSSVELSWRSRRPCGVGQEVVGANLSANFLSTSRRRTVLSWVLLRIGSARFGSSCFEVDADAVATLFGATGTCELFILFRILCLPRFCR